MAWGNGLLSSNDNVVPGPARRRAKGLKAKLIRLRAKLLKLLGGDDGSDTADAGEAVTHFLIAMTAVAERTYPAWSRILHDALADCALSYDDRRGLFEVHPVDDYYFAAVVALEAAKLRGLYPARDASELLSEIGAQVDARAGRHDRVVSDLVFHIIGRIDLGAGMERMKAPYDTAVKAILEHAGLNRSDATRALLRDPGLRHLLGEPLALGVPQWWKSFQTRFKLRWDEPEAVYLADNESVVAAPAVPIRRRVRRRAVAF